VATKGIQMFSNLGPTSNYVMQKWQHEASLTLRTQQY